MLEKQATQISTDIPVRLLRIYPGKTGNIYMPGVYKPGELPKAAYNSYYVAPVAVVEKPAMKTAMEESNLNNGKLKVEDMATRTEGTSLTEDIEIKNPRVNPDDKHLKAKVVKPVVAPAIKINEADKKSLIALNGVAKSTASKIIELREQSGFIDYEDLNGRVPLPFGKDWTAFNVDFS